MTQWRGLSGPFSSPALKQAIRPAVRTVPRKRRRESAKAVTGEILQMLLAKCASDSLRDIMDRAILMVAFASDCRWRSEIAGLRMVQLTEETPIEVPDSPPVLFGNSSWADQNDDRRGRRSRLSHRPACRGIECLADGHQDGHGKRVSGDRKVGNGLAPGARSAVDQRDP